MQAKLRAFKRVNWGSIKHARDASMNPKANWPITAYAIPRTFYKLKVYSIMKHVRNAIVLIL